MSPHRWNVLHEKHLAHLRWLRTAAAGAAAAAIVAAGVTYAATGSPSGAGSSGGDPAQAAFSVPLQTVPLSVAAQTVSGDTFVTYQPSGEAGATLSGTIADATAGETVSLYARQFPYTGAWAPVSSAAVSPAGGSAAYSFKATPVLATQYQVRLFDGSSASSPVAESGITTIYVAIDSPSENVDCLTDGPVCTVDAKETFYAPPAVIAKEMAKRWYTYAAANIQPGTTTPAEPTTLTLGALRSSASDPQETGTGTFTMTIKLTFDRGSDSSEFRLWPCAPDTEAQDGFGLPGSHGCGTATTIDTGTGYLG